MRFSAENGVPQAQLGRVSPHSPPRVPQSLPGLVMVGAEPGAAFHCVSPVPGLESAVIWVLGHTARTPRKISDSTHRLKLPSQPPAKLLGRSPCHRLCFTSPLPEGRALPPTQPRFSSVPDAPAGSRRGTPPCRAAGCFGREWGRFPNGSRSPAGVT